MNNKKSSYLQYLPPALWRDEPDAPEVSLGRFLLSFEKLLTGVEDGSSFVQSRYQHESIEHTLDVLHELYNPFKIQSDDSEWTEQWLTFLASWVGLSPLSSWDEHQKRKLIADAVEIHNIRGLKRGLYKYLEIYLVSELKPRITIDIGETVFRLPLANALDKHAQVITSGPPIIHPLSVQVDKTSPSFKGQIIIGDYDPHGTDSARIWRIKSTGEYEYNTIGGRNSYYPLYNGDPLNHIILPPPDPLKPVVDRKPIYTPIAIVDDYDSYYGIADSGSGNSGSASKILRVPKLSPYATTSVSLVWVGPPMIRAVDMVINSSGNYVVLDRGNFDLGLPVGSTGGPLDVCKILEIQPDMGTGGIITGAVLNQIDLPIIVEPMALTIHPDGDYIVADIGVDPVGGALVGTDGITIASTSTFTSASATFITSSVKVGDTLSILFGNDSVDSPYQILQVVTETELLILNSHGRFTGDTGQTWLVHRRTEIYKINSTTGNPTSLLSGIPIQQPYPAKPTALLMEDSEHLLILDYGVKNRTGTKPLVQPARIWRLAIPPATPSLEIVNQDIGFVWPTDMSMDLKENVIIVDQGGRPDDRDWRAPDFPHEFGVILHFTDSAAPASYRTARAISDIIRTEKQAETYFRLRR